VTSDEQEAASVRYVAAVLVVPLSSGSFAIYARDFSTFLGTFTGLAEAEQIIREAAKREQSRAERECATREVLRISGKSLEDLGL